MSDTGLTVVFSKNACPRKSQDINFLMKCICLSNAFGSAAGPYSQAIKAAGQVWVAGQIPADAQGNLVTGSIAEKTEQCIKNLKAILEEAGSEIPKIVRVGVSFSLSLFWLDIFHLQIPQIENALANATGTLFYKQVFLSDMQHFKEMNGEYEKWFTHKPARTCVAAKQLPLGVDVEIEAIAIQ
jgi:2-iminobutanoate/2-iminopropanoate deaminase